MIPDSGLLFWTTLYVSAINVILSPPELSVKCHLSLTIFLRDSDYAAVYKSAE